jgi:glycosyltransferase involved in cell wall biosynthesis
MIEQPLISVITVVYNGVTTLEQTMLSVINQIYKNIEYIIIDGGSTDGTIDIIKKYEKHLAYWVSEPDNGIYDAMNKGIDKATGEWINFMNSGDWFYNAFVIDSVFATTIEEEDIIYGKKYGQKTNIKKINRHFFLKYLGICHQTIFARKKTLNSGFNLKYKLASDFDWLMKSYTNGVKIRDINKIIVSYQGGGVSETNLNFIQKEIYEILKTYYPHWIAFFRKLIWILNSFFR